MLTINSPSPSPVTTLISDNDGKNSQVFTKKKKQESWRGYFNVIIIIRTFLRDRILKNFICMQWLSIKIRSTYIAVCISCELRMMMVEKLSKHVGDFENTAVKRHEQLD